MIKAILLDVDGIIVGEKTGDNSPNPHQEVMAKLKKIREKGIPICLYTAKPHYAISEIIKGAYLHNPHITDAGAVIINPIDNFLIEKHTIEKSLVRDVLQSLIIANVYTEIYTVDEYFIQKSQESEITQKHIQILKKEPLRLPDILAESSNLEITKIMSLALNEEDKKRVTDILQPFGDKLSISWGIHPIALPLQFGIITALGSSKKEGVGSIVKSLDIYPDEILGIGDSISDWEFMQVCGYAATLTNGSEELKELLKSKGEGQYYIGPKSVDENGILDVLQYFFYDY